jgi:hypothetical protein
LYLAGLVLSSHISALITQASIDRPPIIGQQAEGRRRRVHPTCGLTLVSSAECQRLRTDAFAAEKEDRFEVTARLIDGPEFAWYFANVLDEMIQGKFANDSRLWVTCAVAWDRKSWMNVSRPHGRSVGHSQGKPATGFLIDELKHRRVDSRYNARSSASTRSSS